MSPLSCTKLAFSYDKKPLLTDINLDFKTGQFVGLIGANGSGKSTLLQLLLGLIKQQSGSVNLNGVNIHAQKRRDIAKQLAFVPQSIELPYAFTVQALVAMGRNPYLGPFELETAEDTRIIQEAMLKTDIIHLKTRSVTTLSGGEKQRVIIARALAQQAATILLDEPIASLDICHQIETLQLIQSLTQSGKLAITALHDLNLAASYCDRLILLGETEFNHGAGKANSGRTIIADGTPEQVLNQKNLSTYFSINADIIKINNKISLANISPVKKD
ncbi:ABC transporter for cobalamin/Fe3+-siderophores ATP-binding protein [Psychromonas ingrahamii 37]|uniref:ABC transporter for cobalamin/Fe3+-siderophores ATP-binding protein n=1 Tax=Psychromonas ingrahamii (strain DSM 17664 / CCUG 51855 / 37) TaxID=357804 RepID=A1SZW5_PSYIN|nr:ABC transporter ATP-binding protein [Psychromonas ingrahamii]ABM05030.1 ABC transporter for cobalamin/Fe3+-siderophores ATP-binding protein [Psychromonas ingrahamii 37]